MKPVKSRVALLGADTLIGREIREVLEAARPDVAVDSYSFDDGSGVGEDETGEVFTQEFSADALKGALAVVTAGNQETVSRALEFVGASPGTTLIDCTSLLEHHREARITAPLLLPGKNDAPLQVVANSAATALAMVLNQLAGRTSVARAVVEIFEPASERGKAGITELQQQTTSLLAFRPLEKHVFDAQLSFAVLPGYGSEAPQRLDTIEQRIENHLATLLARLPAGASIPMPSIRLIQAPVFHGYSLSAWVELGETLSAADIEAALASKHIEIRTSENEIPTNVGVAGQSEVIVGDIRIDRNNPRAVWLWIVADNLRLMAQSVAEAIKLPERKTQ
jgi:aspartate-semialdehyde dehydrogenase